MKMTKEGKLPGKELYVGKCSYCNSEFEAIQEELKRAATGYNETSYTGLCLLCGQIVYFDSKPKGLRHKHKIETYSEY